MDTIATSVGSSDATSQRSRTHRLPDGRTIGYAVYGAPQGRPVIALHGTPGSRFMFALADVAARDRNLRIVAPDRAGYGLSTFRRHQSLTQAAEDVRSLADALGLDQFALIGVSGGGPYAVAAATLMHDRVASLALICPVGPIAECNGEIRMSAFHKLIFLRMAQTTAPCGAFFLTVKGLLRTAPGLAHRILMQRAVPSDRAVLTRPDVRANLQAALREGLRPGVKGAIQDLHLYCARWALPLADIDIPAVMWQGSDDPIVPAEAAYYLAKALPHCRLDVIDGGGHYWAFDRFGTVLDAVGAASRET